ncbi:hypothetical protein [Nitrolancea hollandica]|uniref:Uncharacterized protein n=1 Tax=Nitrolancea hollandica Lb TaxID=1129897 RepID=I4EG09_9BACT|nr:hypothetical protein [Nitrolancea hollandica]CCF83621.1 hypothetical protein NITHO_2510019 [Nitrolancea hollandica Lb]
MSPAEVNIRHDLKIRLPNGRTKSVEWFGGDDPIAVCKNYADSHPGVTVVGWRYPLWELQIGFHPDMIVEPGHRDWGKKRVWDEETQSWKIRRIQEREAAS